MSQEGLHSGQRIVVLKVPSSPLVPVKRVEDGNDK